MKPNICQFLALLGAQCLIAARGETPRVLGDGDETEFSSKQTISELANVTDSISSGFAMDLFGRSWSARNMDFIGGDEFVQMYDDKVETRIVVRGYMDNNVDTASNGKVLIFSDRELHDVHGNIRGQTQGICTQAEHGNATYICSINYEILDEDLPEAHVVAAFRAEGAMDLGKATSKFTVTGGHTELEGASGTIHVAPVSLDKSTDPSTPQTSSGAYLFDYFFFEAVIYISSEYLHSIMKEEDIEAER